MKKEVEKKLKAITEVMYFHLDDLENLRWENSGDEELKEILRNFNMTIRSIEYYLED